MWPIAIIELWEFEEVYADKLWTGKLIACDFMLNYLHNVDPKLFMHKDNIIE